MLNSLIDNGNTVQLVDQVATTLAPEVQARRLELLNQSPFLSMDALFELCNQISIFGDAVVFEILMANPDVTRQPAFDDHLREMVEQSQFPEWMYEAITANADQVTYRTILNRNDAAAVSNMMQTYREVSYSQQNDSIGFDNNTHRHWLVLLQNPEADMMLAEEYLEDGDIATANTITDSIPLKYTLDEKQQTEQTDFRDWLNLKISWLKSEQSMNELSSQNLADLKKFADSHSSLAGTKAKNVINFFYDGNYRNYPEIPDEAEMRKSEPKAKVTKPITDIKNYVKVYPNPSNSYVAFEYKVPCNYAAHLEVFNTQGVNVLIEEVTGTQSLKIINASQFVDGTYYYKLICDNNIIGQGNFIIQK